MIRPRFACCVTSWQPPNLPTTQRIVTGTYCGPTSLIRRTGTYEEDVLRMLSDPMAESIIGMIHDGFVADDEDRLDCSAERVSAIMRELTEDRDRLTRILAVLEQERTRLQKR
jgi:hypothetical protein